MNYQDKVSAFILAIIFSGTNIVNAMNGGFRSSSLLSFHDEILKTISTYFSFPTSYPRYQKSYSNDDLNSRVSVFSCGEKSDNEFVVKFLKNSGNSHSSKIKFGKERAVCKLIDIRNLSDASNYIIKPIPMVTSCGNFVVASKHRPDIGDKQITEYIRAHKKPLNALKEILNQILSIVKYLDKNGIIHGDLHRQNIIFSFNKDQELEIRALDFGESSIFSTCPQDRENLKFETASINDLLQLMEGLRHIVRISSVCFTNTSARIWIDYLTHCFENISYTIMDISEQLDSNENPKFTKSHRQTILDLLVGIINTIDVDFESSEFISKDDVKSKLDIIRRDFGLKNMERWF